MATDNMTTTTTSTATTTTIGVSTSAPIPERPGVLDRLMPELMAIPEKELIQVNVDIPLSVTIVLGNLPEIMRLREHLVKAMPDFDVSALDKLEERTFAAYEAHGRYLIATKPRNELEQALERGTQLRDTLLNDAKALTGRGLLEEGKLRELLGPVGHRNLAVDLNVLHHALKESWPQIEGKCAIKLDEIDDALVISERIIRLVGLRDQGTAGVAQATDVRVRAFTKFAIDYDKVRRAIAYLRWNENDADKIAPSLYSGKASRKRGGDAGTDDGTQVPPTQGSPNPTAPGPSPSSGNTVVPAGSIANGFTAMAPASNGGASASPESDPFLK